MLGNRWATRAEIARDATDRERLGAEQAEDFSARRIGDRLENGFGLFAFHGNHMVTINVTEWLPCVKQILDGERYSLMRRIYRGSVTQRKGRPGHPKEPGSGIRSLLRGGGSRPGSGRR